MTHKEKQMHQSCAAAMVQTGDVGSECSTGDGTVGSDSGYLLQVKLIIFAVGWM